MTESLVVQTVPLGFHWPTVDPFLFCVHHLDPYPAGNEQLGPGGVARRPRHRAGLRRHRRLAHVPRRRRARASRSTPTAGSRPSPSCAAGCIDHSDSLGATARFGRGDVQWLTAGAGIVHCEMFPLLDRDGPNPVELFQIWLNLPAADKMVEPHFTMLWDDDIPRRGHVDDDGRATEITVIAGALGGVAPAAAAAALVGVAARRRRRHLAPAARPRRRVDAAAGRGPDTVRDALRVRRRRRCTVGDAASSAASTGAVLRADAPVDGRRRATTAPRSWCCRAGRSASRWRSTARS